LLSVLALEVTEKRLRALVMARGLKGLQISQCLSLERTATGPFPSLEELDNLLARMPGAPKNMVVVSSQVTLVSLPLELARLRALRGERLKEALRWEAEPYLPGPPLECLLGYEEGRQVSEALQEVWVSAMLREEYQALKGVLGEAGLRLLKVYPPEACFSWAALYPRLKGEGAVLYLEEERAILAQVEEGRLTYLRTLPLTLEEIKAFGSARKLHPEVAAAVEEMALPPGGLALILPEGEEEFREFLPPRLEARPLSFPCPLGPCPSCFASLVEAAARQLSFRPSWQAIGVDDRLPLWTQITRRIHLAPLMALLVVFALFSGHYLAVKYQTKRLAARAEVLRAQKEELERAKKQYDELKKEEEKLRQEQDKKERQLEFLRSEYALEPRRLSPLFALVSQEIPSIREFQPLGQGAYRLTAEAPEVGTINRLVTKLQASPWCAYALLEKIEVEEKSEKITLPPPPGEASPKTLEIKRKIYKFTLRIQVTP